MVLQGAGNDLRRGSRAMIYEHNHLGAIEYVTAMRGTEKTRVGRSSFCGHNDAGIQEQVRYIDRRIENAARAGASEIVVVVTRQP